MQKLVKWTSIALGCLLLLGGLAWWNRTAIALKGIEILADRRTSVGPFQEVAWASGRDTRARNPQERPPNIVLILADDLGWNDLSLRGGGVAGGAVPTPHINSIAHDGVVFENGYAGNGTCAPSRAAILSGRYGTRFGFEFTPVPPGMSTILGMITSQQEGRVRAPIFNPDTDSLLDYDQLGMPSEEITIAELLQGAGYHTAHIGKWHLGRGDGMMPQEQGFDESLLMHSGLYLPDGDPRGVSAKLSFDPIDQFLWSALKFAASFNGGEAFEPGGYLTDYYTDEALKVIEANKERPFFLYLAHWAPHTPLQASKEDYDALPQIELHRERVYGAMIRSLDRGVGRVLDALRDNGLEDNTIVIFTSDNGGAHYIGLPEVNAPFRGWKISFFEGGIHVPYFMKWPAQIPAGESFAAPVHHFDIFATAAAAAGIAVPVDRTIDGVDLVAHVRGKTGGIPHERLFWRSGASSSALVNGWKLTLSDPPGRAWLFDMKNDPTERRDLSAALPDKVAELKAALAEHNAEQQQPRWPSAGSMPIPIDKDITIPEAEDDEYIYWSN
ncbi:MAG: sulfatase-like hydrolase/transferase [Deltaproteobacteria bacterium]